MYLRLANSIPRHLYVTILSWFFRGIYLLISLCNIKLATSLLNVDEFAIYAILANVVTWLLLADFGIGNSIQNFISEYRVKGKSYKQLIITGISIAILFAVVLVFILTASKNYLAETLLQYKSLNSTISKVDLFYWSSIFGVLTAIGTISHKIMYAEQKGYLPNVLSGLSALTTLILMLLFKNVSLNRSFYVIISFFAPNVLFNLGPAIFYLASSYFTQNFVFRKSEILMLAKRILKRSSSFLIFMFASALTLQVDYIVMSQTVGSLDIAQYNILFKVYSSIYILYNTLLMSLWPTFAELYVQKRNKQILKYCTKYIIAGIVFIMMCTLTLLVKKDFVLGLISSIKFEVHNLTIILFMVYFALRVWTDTFAIVLQSSNKLKVLWAIVPFQAIISFGLQFILSKYLGLQGILYGLICSFLLTVAWALPFFVKRNLKNNQ